MALISYQRNPYTREWNLKLCNMSILKSRSNFEKQKGVLYFIGIPVFFYGLKDKMVRKYSESIFKLFPDHDLYICSYSGAGEVFQLALRLPSFIKKSQKRNPCVICTNNKLVQIFEMVLGKKYQFISFLITDASLSISHLSVMEKLFMCLSIDFTLQRLSGILSLIVLIISILFCHI